MVSSINYRSISSIVLCEEAQKLGLSVEIISKKHNFFRIYSKEKSIVCKNTDFGINTALGYKIAEDKTLSHIHLAHHDIPVPRSAILYKDQQWESQIDDLIADIGFPLVVKPSCEAHGIGVVTDTVNREELIKQIVDLFGQYDTVIVQKQIDGEEVRVLVCQGKVLLAKNRIPAHVIGDGIMSIQELIDRENTNPLRGHGYEKPLSYIIADQTLQDYIQKQGYTLTSILSHGEYIQLRGTSNLGTGGTLRDVTSLLCDEIKKTCIKAAEVSGLGICGIDIISPDISAPLESNNGVVLEINATPSLGGDRELSNTNTAKKMLEMLFFS